MITFLEETTGGAPGHMPNCADSCGLIIWLSAVVFPLSGDER